jgi:hypothetical protein
MQGLKVDPLKAEWWSEKGGTSMSFMDQKKGEDKI